MGTVYVVHVGRAFFYKRRKRSGAPNLALQSERLLKLEESGWHSLTTSAERIQFIYEVIGLIHDSKTEINQVFGLALGISAKMTLAGWPTIPVCLNRDASSASDLTDVSLALGVNSSPACEICDKDNSNIGTLSISTWFTVPNLAYNR